MFGYSKTLESASKARYDQKLKVLGLTDCPYDLPADCWKNNPTKWPEVQYPDVYSYLIETPGVFTKESMKNHKSLEARKFLLDGWVQTVYYTQPEDLSNTFILRADVTPSYRINDEPHHPWVAVKNDGVVLAAHCDCLAGLGESCSHVGALLFKIEAAVRNGYTRVACTDEPCKWNQCFQKKVQPAAVTDIKFYKDETKEKLKLSKRKRKQPLSESSPEEQQAFLKELKECGELPVGLSLFKETYEPFHFKETVDIVRLLTPLSSLYNDRNVQLTEQELQNKCEDIISEMKATKDEVEFLHKSTINQTKSLVWHEQRKGRVTASVAHSILHTNQDNPAPSIIKKMCHPSNQVLNTAAVKWGRDHEDTARETYRMAVMTQHENVDVKQTGLTVCKEKTFIGASPDGLFSCSCHGLGVVEIKCPYKFRDMDGPTMVKNKDCCLNEEFQLKNTHEYYDQIQLQIYVHDTLFGHFILWTNKTCLIVTVPRDNSFLDKAIPKLETFWKRHCLPELLTNRMMSEPIVSDPQPSTSKQLYCYCQTEDDGSEDMVGCDNPKCKYQWVHYRCAKIKRAPKNQWYCKDCKKGKANNAKP